MQISRRVSIRSATVLGAAAVAIASCGGGGEETSTDPPPTPAPADASAAASQSPTPANQTPATAELAATLTEAFATSSTLDGGPAFDGATLAGSDSVVWFWAPWCTICRAEAPEVAEIAEQYASQVNLIGVPGRGELDAMVEFVDDTGTGSITHIADLDGDIWSAFGVYGQPAFAFIDDAGTVDVFIGGLGGDALAERIDDLITT